MLVAHMNCKNWCHCPPASGAMSGWTEIIHRARGDSCPHAEDNFNWLEAFA